MWIHVLSTACDVISFNGQGQLCQPTCRVKRSFKPYQNDHNSVKDTQEKGKKPCHIDPNIFHENLVPLPTYLSFLKTFPTKMKPSKCPAREKKWGKKSQKGGEERKRKVKVKSAVSLFNPKPVSKFYFLHMPELCKLMVCIWIKRLQSVQPVNGFVVSFSSLQQNSDQKTTRLASKHVFQQNLPGQMG